MPQAVTLNLVLYVDNTCLIYNSEVKEIEKQFIEDFDWNLILSIFILVRIKVTTFILQVTKQKISVN